MPLEPPGPEDDAEDRVDQVIAEYLAAAQAGRAPDRQELLRRHPDLAQPLAAFFADQDHFDRVAAPLKAERPIVPEREFGDYVLHAEIARGGMGVVYRATQTSLNRPVALKMILAGPRALPADIQRFRSEAEAVAALDHPHIVPVYEVGQHGGQPYFSMKLVEGGNLTQHLDRYAGNPRAAVELVATLSEAIHHAHQRGILHRDLKPRNILLDCQGQPQITDFGLAQRTDGNGDSASSLSGDIVGTASYMAPEQARAERPFTTAVDIFSLGAILYELLTGRPPFRRGTPAETILDVLQKEPQRPRAANPRVDRDLETICLKCLQKEPQRRYGSAEALAEDLRRWLDGRPIAARPAGSLERLWRWCRRNPAMAAAISAASAIIVLLTLVFSWRLVNENALTRAALQREGQALVGMRRARDQAQDRLARSRYEQARALVVSGLPGRRWEALDLLQESESLRGRPREAGILPAADGDLPARWQLRSEAVTALLQADARLAWSLLLSGESQPALSPDARRALSLRSDSPGGKDAVVLLDLRDRRELGRWDNAQIAGNAFALDRSGRRLASFNPTLGKVEEWEIPAGRKLRTLDWPNLADAEGQPRAAPDFLMSSEMAFSPDGRYLTAVARCRTVRALVLWDLEGSAAGRTFARSSDDSDPGGALFLTGRSELAYPSDKQTVAFWRLPAGEPSAKIRLPLPLVGKPAVDATGRRLACPCAANETGGGTLVICDLAGQREPSRIEADFSLSAAVVAFHPRDDRLAMGTRDGRILVFDLASASKLITLPGAHADRVVDLRWDEDGRHLLSWGMERMLKRWELTEPPLAEIHTPLKSFHFAWSRDGRWLALSDAARQKIQIVDRNTGRIERELPGRPPTADNLLLFSPDGRQLADVDAYQAVVWDLPTGRAVARLEEASGLTGLIASAVFTAEGRLLAVAERAEEPKVIVWDLLGGRQLWQSPRESRLDTALLCPDGRQMAGIAPENFEKALMLTALAFPGGREIGRAELSALPMGKQPFSPDGRWMLTLRRPQGDPLYGLLFPSGRTAPPPDCILEHFPVSGEHWAIAGPSAPSAHAFSPDSRLLAIGYRDGSVKLWDTTTAGVLLHSQLRWQPVTQLAFDGDGRWLAVADGKPALSFVDLALLRRELAAVGLDW
jgi:WD40 repeat protein